MYLVSDRINTIICHNVRLIPSRELHLVYTHDVSAAAYQKGERKERIREQRPTVQLTLSTEQHDQGSLLLRSPERVLEKRLVNCVSGRLR
jgi:hypothetical protein